jgi:hypothetical protein
MDGPPIRSACQPASGLTLLDVPSITIRGTAFTVRFRRTLPPRGGCRVPHQHRTPKIGCFLPVTPILPVRSRVRDNVPPSAHESPDEGKRRFAVAEVAAENRPCRRLPFPRGTERVRGRAARARGPGVRQRAIGPHRAPASVESSPAPAIAFHATERRARMRPIDRRAAPFHGCGRLAPYAARARLGLR